VETTFEDLSSRIPFVHRSQDISGNGLGCAVWFDYDRDGQIGNRVEEKLTPRHEVVPGLSTKVLDQLAGTQPLG
jgi:hypothetical protein